MSGANSLLETGNMGFGMRDIFQHSDASFPFSGKRGHCFLGHFFELVFGYSRKVSERRVATCRTTNCAAGNADGPGEISPAPSVTIVSPLWKLPTITTRCARR